MIATYPIIDVTTWAKDRTEQMGSKSKVWVIDNSPQRWLFKENRPHHGEDWSEKVASELATLLGIPHAHVELAVQSDTPGVISRDFVADRHAAQLVHGNELLKDLVDPSYPATGTRVFLPDHTLSRIFEVLSKPFIHLPAQPALPPGITQPAELFVGYLLVDALVGNTDRHHENWAVIDHHAAAGQGREAELAPSFDHASCLGRELSDDHRLLRMTTTDPKRNLAAYIAKMPSRIYRDRTDRHALSPADAFRLAAQQYPVAGTAWLERLAKVAPEAMKDVFDAVPQQRMSQPAREFSLALLESTRRSLLG